MSDSSVDRDTNYMYQMWGTDKLVTDYSLDEKPRVIQEIMHDDVKKKHNLTEQTNLHKKIRNDENYDDWEYGTEPQYGSLWQ